MSVLAIPAAAGGGLTPLEQHAAAASPTLDFTAFQSSLYDAYQIDLNGVIPTTNGVDFYLQYSTDGGSTWIATGYAWHVGVFGQGTGIQNNMSDTKIQLHYSSSVHVSNTAGYSFNGTLYLRMPQAGTTFPTLTGLTHHLDTVESSFLECTVTAVLKTGGAVPNGLRFFMSASSTIASGLIRVGGLRPA